MSVSDAPEDPERASSAGGQIMSPKNGSPVIGAGSDAICAAAPVLGHDQRGQSRPHGAHCDIGAVEK